MVTRNLIVGLSLALGLNACVTSQGGKRSLSGSEDIHVHQTNGQDILTKLDRNHWINIRKTSNSDQMKLYSSLGTREWGVAISDARAYLADHPKDLVALQVLSIGLAMKQNFSLAAYYARLIEKYHPGQVDTLNIQGMAILSQPGATFADFRRAMVKFESSFEGNNKAIASGLNLGHLHMEMGNADAARDVFKIVQDRCGNCEASLLGYGIAATRLKDYEDAQSAFEKILDNNSQHLQAKYYIAVIQSVGFQKKRAAVELLAEVLDDKSGQYIDVKRKANFLMRRLEAQIYAEKNRKPILQDEEVPEEMEIALEKDTEKLEDTNESSDEFAPVSEDL